MDVFQGNAKIILWNKKNLKNISIFFNIRHIKGDIDDFRFL